MGEKSFVVGIAGGTASGKSTLCENLERKLKDYKLFVIRMDYYFKPERDIPRARAFVSRKEYEDHNHPETMDLSRLNKDLERVLEENSHEIIIIEGL